MRAIIVSISVAVSVALLVVLFCFNPEGHGFYPRCPLFLLTGWQCAGCGTLRAAHHLLHGHLSQAIALNPLLVVAVPFLAVLALKPAWAYRPVVGWGGVGVVVAYSVLRNL